MPLRTRPQGWKQAVENARKQGDETGKGAGTCKDDDLSSDTELTDDIIERIVEQEKRDLLIHAVPAGNPVDVSAPAAQSQHDTNKVVSSARYLTAWRYRYSSGLKLCSSDCLCSAGRLRTTLRRRHCVVSNRRSKDSFTPR